MSAIKVVDLTKVYDGCVRAIDGLDLEVGDGEFVVVVGSSGSGKTTLLRVIAGLERQCSGDVFIGEQNVNDVRACERGVAMVFQNYALYPHLNVYENIAFGLKMRKVKKDEIEGKVRDAAAMLEIEELLDRRPATLSGGQRQRVAVGRAIVSQAQVLLYDEPLSNVEPDLRERTFKKLLEIHKTLGVSSIYVTHDKQIAERGDVRVFTLPRIPNGRDFQRKNWGLNI